MTGYERIVLAVVLGLTIGCGDDEEPCRSDAPPPDLSQPESEYLEQSCAFSTSCHSGTRAEPAFPAGHGLLLGGPDTSRPICDAVDRASIVDRDHRPIIACGHCEESFLVVAMDHDGLDPEIASDEYLLRGGRFPYVTHFRSEDGTGFIATAPVCPEDRDAVCEWIDAGCEGCPQP